MKTEIISILATSLYFGAFLPSVTQADSPADAAAVRQPIPWPDIGKAAGAQSHGDALAVSTTDDGALLHCAFQRMDGHVTAGGLWLTSTTTNSLGERFRLAATGLGRAGERNGMSLCLTGKVQVTGSVVRWDRPGLTEKYSISMDGVQQDFVVERRPPGQGELRVDLALSGARAEPAAYGAELILDGSHRALAYSRLRAVDATGKELAAKLEVVSANRLAVEVDDAGASYPVRIDPTFSDANWVSLGSYPGADGIVYTMVEDKNAGTVYIGGEFRAVGTAAAAGIAEWNGSTWLPMGSGLGGTVRGLALDGLGNLYAGGLFTNAVLAITNIAKWNGTSWSVLGPGINGEVLAVAADSSGNVYAGGIFTNKSLSATNVVRWNGSSWSAMGAGINGTILAMALDGTGRLYVGGTFTKAGGLAATNIAEWNGSSWSGLGLGMNSTVSELVTDGADNVYAGGSFTTANGSPAARVAVWNGSTWSPLGTGVNSTVLGLAWDGAGKLYAGGFFTTAGGGSAYHIAVWNGSNWSGLGPGINTNGAGYVYSIALDGSGNVYAGGAFNTAGGLPAHDLARWNGSNWSTFGSGINSTSIYVTLVYAVTVDAGGNLYVGGQFTGVGTTPANNIVEWNGSSWSALGTGIGSGSGTVETLTTDGAGNLYASGTFTNAGGIMANNIAEWNGSTWSALGSGIGGQVYGLVTDHAGNLYAGGYFATVGGVTANSIAEWNGYTWSALSTGVSGNEGLVQTLAFDHAGNLYAGGSFTTAGGVTAGNIAEWNGTTWSALGPGMGGSSPYVFTLAVDASNHLYTGGNFTMAGATAATNIAEWDGANWTAVGSGMNGYVYSLALDPAGNLYAGGAFTVAGGVPANYIAKWDGTAWSALGSGVNGTVLSLAADQAGRLYAGGVLSAAGTNASAYVAQANVLDMISKPHRNPDGSFTFNLLTTPNSTNRVLAITNLAPPAVWRPIATNFAPASGAWQFTDSNASLYPVRFYRSATP
jgi:trimeric autotransporter adhesin